MKQQRKRCPVCKTDKTYAGPICPGCKSLGYRIAENGKPTRLKKVKQKKDALDDFLSPEWDKVKARTVRASAEVWEGVQVVADLKGVSVNALIVASLEKTLEEEL